MSFEVPLALDISNYFPKIKLLNIFYIFVMLSFANRFRPLLINFFVLLIVIILFFAALEILLNFVPYTPSFFKPNSAQVHKTCDFNVTYKINNYGFRDQDFNFKNIEQSFNIVLVGDSMIMGHGIHEHETIARIMEKKLRLKKPKTHVFNLGLSSANPDMYFQVIDSVASKLSPDILILMYYTGNDVHEMSTGVINSESLLYKY